MKSIMTSLKQQMPIAIAKVVLILICLIGLSILMTGCPSPSDGSNNNNNNNNNNNDPVLLPLARVSVNDEGVQADDNSAKASMSSDGNLIAFYSLAKNLAANDTNSYSDVYVYNRKAKTVKWISNTWNGDAPNGGSSQPMISANGGFVAYQSSASNLVDGIDNNSRPDIFVYDMGNNTNTKITVDANGIQAANGGSENPVINANGHIVAFESVATNLLLEDVSDQNWDIFVVDWQTQPKTVEKISAGEIDGESRGPSISADGNLVAFYSDATHLVDGDTDTNNASDVFVYDRTTKAIKLISKGFGGASANGNSLNPCISANGLFVAFESDASNLLAPDVDTNGVRDIFVCNLQNGETKRVSIGEYANYSNQVVSPSYTPCISGDGRYVSFQSNSEDLIGGDYKGHDDIYVRDLVKNNIQLINVTSNVGIGNNNSINAFISADGHYLSFQSDATDMVLGDTNGKTDIFVVPIIPLK